MSPTVASPTAISATPPSKVKSTTCPSTPRRRYHASTFSTARPKRTKLSGPPASPLNASSSTRVGSASPPRATTPRSSGLGATRTIRRTPSRVSSASGAHEENHPVANTRRRSASTSRSVYAKLGRDVIASCAMRFRSPSTPTTSISEIRMRSSSAPLPPLPPPFLLAELPPPPPAALPLPPRPLLLLLEPLLPPPLGPLPPPLPPAALPPPLLLAPPPPPPPLAPPPPPPPNRPPKKPPPPPPLLGAASAASFVVLPLPPPPLARGAPLASAPLPAACCCCCCSLLLPPKPPKPPNRPCVIDAAQSGGPNETRDGGVCRRRRCCRPCWCCCSWHGCQPGGKAQGSLLAAMAELPPTRCACQPCSWRTRCDAGAPLRGCRCRCCCRSDEPGSALPRCSPICWPAWLTKSVMARLSGSIVAAALSRIDFDAIWRLVFSNCVTLRAAWTPAAVRSNTAAIVATL